eukprot:3990369-Pleurochrysis_carterae.AAC.2
MKPALWDESREKRRVRAAFVLVRRARSARRQGNKEHVSATSEGGAIESVNGKTEVPTSKFEPVNSA